MSDTSRYTKLLERLIIDIIPSASSNNSLQKYYQYIHRILLGQFKGEQDENTLKTLITQKVFSIAAENNTQKHTANTTGLRVQELLQKLSRTRILGHKSSILYLLYKLADTGKNAKNSNPGPMEALFKAREDIKKPLNNNSSMDIEKPMIINEKKSSNDSFQVQTIKKLANKGNESINLNENDIIRDLLFVFHAIDGHYINFNDQENAYSIKSGIPLSEPLRNLINTLCEIGFLYKKLNNFLIKPQPGLLRQAFAISIKEELNEYFKLLALLENLRLESDETGTQSLSLRKLSLWIIEPFERLKWLNIMSDGVMELIGGDVLSSIYSYRTHGSPVILQLINRVLINVNQPFLKYIHLWIYQGVINDPIGEFFVSENENENNIWLNKYKLITNKVPSFLEQELAQKIFLSGKTVNFLKKCCNIKEWTLNIEPFDSKELYHTSQFRDWIIMCSNIINQKLLEVLFLNFHLEKHLDFLKKYLLMGQGDLLQNLMDNLTTELNKPALQIYKHQLMGYLETAIRTSNAQYHSSEFVNRLEVKLLEASPGDTGWDIFSLDYRVDSPLNTIFHNDIMRKYLRIFNFLWRVKRVEFCLNTVWINQVKASKYLAGIPGVKKEFHRCHLLRNEMIHFINNLFNYLMVEVIESTWDQFKEKLSHLKELNELIELHDTCIDKILEKALLKDKTEAIYKHLLKIFELIYRLKFTQEILLNKAHEEYSLIQQRKKQREIAELVGEDHNFINEEANKSSFTGESFKILDTISNDYMEALFNFQNLLRKEENIRNLKFLSFKLDFNEYYNNRPNNKFSNMSNNYFQDGNYMGMTENPLDYHKKQKPNTENSQNAQVIQTTSFFQNIQTQNKSNFLESALTQSKANFIENSQTQNKSSIAPIFPPKIEKTNLQKIPGVFPFDLNIQKNTIVLEEPQKNSWIEDSNNNENKVIEPIFRHDIEEERDEFLQEGEDDEDEEYNYEEGDEFDPDKTNSFRKK